MRRTRGYVLLEAVGALAVLSVGIVAVHDAMRESLLTRAQARDYTQARFLLQELVSELQVRPKLPEGQFSGDYGENYPRFSWNYSVKRIQLPEAERAITTQIGPDGMPIPLKIPVKYIGQIEVEIKWALRGAEFSVKTQTLCQPERLVGYDAEETT